MTKLEFVSIQSSASFHLCEGYFKMNILRLFFVVCFALVSFQFAYASPLIFKITKEVTNAELLELGNFDASKYKQIRVTVKISNKAQNNLVSKDIALVDLDFAKREFNRVKELYEQGVYSKSQYDRAEERLKVTQQIYDNALEIIYPPVSIFGLEGTEEIFISSFDERSLTNSIVIDSPPTKVSVKVFGRGTYKLFVWASV